MGGIYHNYLGCDGCAGATHGGCEFADIRHVHAARTQAARMHGEIYARRHAGLQHAVVQHVVEMRAAAGQLQALDTAVAAVVQHHDDELFAQHHRGGDFRVHHEVGTVAHHHDDLLLRPGHLHAQAAGYLVAHARVTVFHVVVAGCAGTPELVQLGRQRASGAYHYVARVAVGSRVAYRAYHFGVVRQDACVLRVGLGRGDFHDASHPARGQVGGRLGPGRVGAPVASRLRQLRQAAAGIGCERQAVPFARVVRLHVQAQNAGLGKQAVGAGGEVLQTRSNRQYQVGTPRQLIGARCTGDTDRTQVERVVPGQAAFTGLGFGHGHTMFARERVQCLPGLAVQHAPARHDQGAFGRAQQPRRVGQVARIGDGAADTDRLGMQETRRAVEGFGLHVLRQGQAHRPASGRIGHRCDRLRQCRQNLFRPGDAVEVARQRAKGVVDTHVAVPEVLQLL